MQEEFNRIQAEIRAEESAQLTAEPMCAYDEMLKDEPPVQKDTRAPLNPDWPQFSSVRKDVVNIGGVPREVIIYEMPQKTISFDKNAQGNKISVNLTGQSEEATEVYSTETFMDFI